MITPIELNATPYARNLQRQPDAHKGDTGKVLLIGGAPSMAGALVLAGTSALYAGAGLVVLCMLDTHSARVNVAHPELMIHAAQWAGVDEAMQFIASQEPSVLVVGMGLGQSELAKNGVYAALRYAAPVVLDADALNLIPQDAELAKLLATRTHATILTPHPGEAARLLGISTESVQCDRLTSMQKLTDKYTAIVVLKGHATLIGAAGEPVQICVNGNAGMATGGMGDVLAGAIGALIAQGRKHHLTPWQATCLAVQTHALAADQLVARNIGPIGLTASEVAREIRVVLNACAVRC